MIQYFMFSNFENNKNYYIIKTGDDNMLQKAINLVDLTNSDSLSKCTEVTDFSNPSYYTDLFDQMKNICIKEGAYGCAAPHFGLTDRFILVLEKKKSNSAKVDIIPYFNPKITFMCGEQLYYEASMGIENCMGEVRRPYYIELKAQDINGNMFRKNAYGLEAIILCHEIDLLDNIKFTDRAHNILYNVNENQRILIRKKHQHEIISADCIYNSEVSKQKQFVHKK